MNARDSILSAARAVTLPRRELLVEEALTGPPNQLDLVQRFIEAARATAADVVSCEHAMLATVIGAIAPNATRVMSAVDGIASTVVNDAGLADVAQLEVFVCQAVLGVAENGAVWLPRSRLGARAAVFLAEHVVVVVERSTLASDLHDAYARIDAAAESFGVFIAGPSKTADIEQSLVIGAHGPKRLTVLLT